MTKEYNNRYDYFHNYTKEQIDMAFQSLTAYEIELEEKKVNTYLTKQEVITFYGVILPKLNRLLQNICKYEKALHHNQAEEAIKKQFIATQYLEKHLTTLSIEEIVTLALQLGYIGEKSYSSKEIYKMLGIQAKPLQTYQKIKK